MGLICYRFLAITGARQDGMEVEHPLRTCALKANLTKQIADSRRYEFGYEKFEEEGGAT
jgi:hypothetical protein